MHASVDPLVRLLRVAAPLATPVALGLTLLREDPQFARIEPSRRERLVEAALDDGRRLACEVRARFGAQPEAIAQACGLSVIDCDFEQGWGSALVYADYQPRARCIGLYRPTIERVERALSQEAVAQLAGASSARAPLIAHELYHHFEALRAAPSLARQHRVVLLRLGRLRWTSGLASLSEIAAGGFAQALLGLRLHPRFFDLITLHQVQPAAAQRLLAALRAHHAADAHCARGSARLDYPGIASLPTPAFSHAGTERPQIMRSHVGNQPAR